MGAREESAHMLVTAVHPWRERREMCADRQQDRGTVHREECVGNVNRKSYPRKIQTVTVKPLAGDMDSGLAPVGCLDNKAGEVQESPWR